MLRLINLQKNDIDEIVTAFRFIGWDKSTALFESYLNEQG